MKTSTLAWIVVVLVIIVGGWYLWMQSATPAPLQTTPTTTTGSTSTSTGDGTPISENLTLGTDATSSLGTYLIAYNGLTLYTYSKDTAGTSTCYSTCAQTWPPYVVPAGMTLNIESGITSQAATIERADGTYQVTYNGMPLYFYSGDMQSGDTNGQGIGGTWFVVHP